MGAILSRSGAGHVPKLYYGSTPAAVPMKTAENRNKVANIVQAQSTQFKELYHRLAVGLPGVHWPLSSTRIQVRAPHLASLALTH